MVSGTLRLQCTVPKAAAQRESITTVVKHKVLESASLRDILGTTYLFREFVGRHTNLGFDNLVADGMPHQVAEGVEL